MKRLKLVLGMIKVSLTLSRVFGSRRNILISQDVFNNLLNITIFLQHLGVMASALVVVSSVLELSCHFEEYFVVPSL